MAVTIATATVTVEDLAHELGLDGDGGDQAEQVQQAFDTAQALVDDTFADAARDVPEAIVNQVYLEVGMEVFKRLDAPAGASQYATPDGGNGLVRGPRDPLSRSMPIIRRYVMPF